MTSRRTNDDTRAPWAILQAELLAMAPSMAQLPEATGVEIAFAGRSNVGKSSAMNVLLGRRRLVRTSSTPGCTRALGLFSAKARDGQQFVMVDLPGYGYAQRSRSERATWASLIDAYLARRAALRGVVVLIDARHGLTEADAALLELLAQVRSRVAPPGRVEEAIPPAPPPEPPTPGEEFPPSEAVAPAYETPLVGPLPFVIAATKIDKVASSRRKATLAEIQRACGQPVIGVSAITGDGIGPLWQAIRRFTQQSP